MLGLFAGVGAFFFGALVTTVRRGMTEEGGIRQEIIGLYRPSRSQELHIDRSHSDLQVGHRKRPSCF